MRGPVSLRRTKEKRHRYDRAASNGSYVANDPVNRTDPTGMESVIQGKNIVIRPEDQTVPQVTIPNTVSATGVSGSCLTCHTYDVQTPSNITDAEAVGAGIANNPTPGPGNGPASTRGTINDAGPLPVSLQENYVRSFLVASPDPSRFTDITVNYTIADGHALEEGFVIRYGVISEGGITLRSYGEGNSWKQAPILSKIWGPQVQRVWMQNHNQIIDSFR